MESNFYEALDFSWFSSNSTSTSNYVIIPVLSGTFSNDSYFNYFEGY